VAVVRPPWPPLSSPASGARVALGRAELVLWRTASSRERVRVRDCAWLWCPAESSPGSAARVVTGRDVRAVVVAVAALRPP
jgi:hypothetical protein